MKRILFTIAAAGALMTAAPALAQAGWTGIDTRQAQLDARIDQGMRNGSLTRNEGMQLRAEFRDIAVLEARYKSNGLTDWERGDLNRRFDMLSARIRSERADNQDRNGRGGMGAWTTINQRQAALDRRIDRGLRDGTLTRREADRLRAEFREISLAEARYRRDGRLDRREEAELDRRFDVLAARIRLERSDWQRYSQGYGR